MTEEFWPTVPDFTEKFQQALDIGGVVHLPPNQWLTVSAPLVQKKPVVIHGNGATLRQNFDTKEGALFTHVHNDVNWSTSDLRISDLVLWGEQGDPDSTGIDLANANRILLSNVYARRLGTAYLIRTVGPNGQCEHNDLHRVSWSQCVKGVKFETNPDKPSGGHKGNRIRHFTGHETVMHIHAAEGSNIYTSRIDGHMWHNKQLPWSIGCWFEGGVTGLWLDVSWETHWGDRKKTVALPVGFSDRAVGLEQVRGHLHVTNDADGAIMPWPLPPMMGRTQTPLT